MTPEIRKLVDAKVEETYRVLEENYGREFPRPWIKYNLRGKTYAALAHPWENVIRLNINALQDYLEDMVKSTVPHEVAHLVADNVYGDEISPHGAEWKRVMAVLGLPANRCTSYNLPSARKVERKYGYFCPCGRSYDLTVIIHNKIQRGQQRICLDCRGPITDQNFVGER